MQEAEIKNYHLPSICHRITLQKVSVQLYNFTFILVKIMCLMLCDNCFVSFHLHIYFSS